MVFSYLGIYILNKLHTAISQFFQEFSEISTVILLQIDLYNSEILLPRTLKFFEKYSVNVTSTKRLYRKNASNLNSTSKISGKY